MRPLLVTLPLLLALGSVGPAMAQSKTVTTPSDPASPSASPPLSPQLDSSSIPTPTAPPDLTSNPYSTVTPYPGASSDPTADPAKAAEKNKPSGRQGKGKGKDNAKAGSGASDSAAGGDPLLSDRPISGADPSSSSGLSPYPSGGATPSDPGAGVGRNLTATGKTMPPTTGRTQPGASAMKPSTEADMAKAQKATEARNKAWDAKMRKTMGSICVGC